MIFCTILIYVLVFTRKHKRESHVCRLPSDDKHSLDFYKIYENLWQSVKRKNRDENSPLTKLIWTAKKSLLATQHVRQSRTESSQALWPAGGRQDSKKLNILFGCPVTACIVLQEKSYGN